MNNVLVKTKLTLAIHMSYGWQSFFVYIKNVRCTGKCSTRSNSAWIERTIQMWIFFCCRDGRLVFCLVGALWGRCPQAELLKQKFMKTNQLTSLKRRFVGPSHKFQTLFKWNKMRFRNETMRHGLLMTANCVDSSSCPSWTDMHSLVVL